MSMEYIFLFPIAEKVFKKSTKNARVIVENKVVPFYETRRIYCDKTG